MGKGSKNDSNYSGNFEKFKAKKKDKQHEKSKKRDPQKPWRK